MPQEIEVVDLTALVPNLSWREEADTVTSITRCIGKPLETIAFNEFWHNGIPAPVWTVNWNSYSHLANR